MSVPTIVGPASQPVDLEALRAIEQRILWLAIRMIDFANRDRPNPDGIKVGGHQASSASMVTVMTALWFAHLERGDLVSVKPHASPVLHAIHYLLGQLDRSYLTTLRRFGGLQAYPSRTKDPDRIDFSTGSVGLGVVAPLFAAMTRRYVNAHFGPQPASRFIALLGDAELDEGNVWEAITDPATAGLGNVTWVVDLNRQSLDRVIPGIKAQRLERMFADNNWHVVKAKYGARLEVLFAAPDGDALRAHIDAMTNERYQSLFAYRGAELRTRFLDEADPAVRRVLDTVDDEELASVVQNLGGHDLARLIECFRACDAETDRPSVLFAYTIKGYGLPIAGDPANHSALLTRDQIDELRRRCGLAIDDEWDRFPDGSSPGILCSQVSARLRRDPEPRCATRIEVPADSGLRALADDSTQAAFGRVLTALARDESLASRMVTTAPDVSVTTNLGGWINKVGVFTPEQQRDWLGGSRLQRWEQGPAGRHLELGISEMNFFSALGMLGLAAVHSGQPLLPIGTIYDTFICRGLDAFVYAAYSGSRFVLVGTPSGVSLAAEGGAHQSTITPSIGVELPGVTFVEPAFARAVDWLLCDGLRRVADLEAPPEITYLRLSTRPISQAPFNLALDRLGEQELRRQVLAGGYRLVDASAGGDRDRPVVQLCAAGAVVSEAVAAATVLDEEGVAANVIDVTSIDRLHAGWRAVRRRDVRTARSAAVHACHLARLLPPGERAAPIVTIHDGASHAMSWLGSVFGARVIPLGVDEFGQSGTIADLYATHDLSAESIVNAALLALSD